MDGVRRTSRRAALGGAASLLLPSIANAASAHAPLFHIERSKNSNVVQYDAVLASPERLDAREPVVCYWVLHAKDGRREALTSLERRAYGFKVIPESNGSCLVYLAAASDRAIRVVRWQGRWLAQIVLQGRSAILARIFVAHDSGLIPSVRWVDLFGTDMMTGRPLTERLKP